jgi:hypothetical protein
MAARRHGTLHAIVRWTGQPMGEHWQFATSVNRASKHGPTIVPDRFKGFDLIDINPSDSMWIDTLDVNSLEASCTNESWFPWTAAKHRRRR